MNQYDVFLYGRTLYVDYGWLIQPSVPISTSVMTGISEQWSTIQRNTPQAGWYFAYLETPKWVAVVTIPNLEHTDERGRPIRFIGGLIHPNNHPRETQYRIAAIADHLEDVVHHHIMVHHDPTGQKQKKDIKATLDALHPDVSPMHNDVSPLAKIRNQVRGRVFPEFFSTHPEVDLQKLRDALSEGAKEQLGDTTAKTSTRHSLFQPLPEDGHAELSQSVMDAKLSSIESRTPTQTRVNPVPEVPALTQDHLTEAQESSGLKKSDVQLSQSGHFFDAHEHKSTTRWQPETQVAGRVSGPVPVDPSLGAGQKSNNAESPAEELNEDKKTREVALKPQGSQDLQGLSGGKKNQVSSETHSRSFQKTQGPVSVSRKPENTGGIVSFIKAIPKEFKEFWNKLLEK